MKEHCGSVEKNIGPILGRHRGDLITPVQIDAAYALWRKQGLSASSIRRQHSILSAAFGQAVKWGWVDRNPVKRASPPSVRRGEDRSMSTGDVRRLIETTEQTDPVPSTAIALGAVTGVHRGELCALHWSDVDLESGILTVVGSITLVKGTATVGNTKTHDSWRISLGPFAVETLRRRRVYLGVAGGSGQQRARPGSVAAWPGRSRREPVPA